MLDYRIRFIIAQVHLVYVRLRLIVLQYYPVADPGSEERGGGEAPGVFGGLPQRFFCKF